MNSQGSWDQATYVRELNNLIDIHGGLIDLRKEKNARFAVSRASFYNRDVFQYQYQYQLLDFVERKGDTLNLTVKERKFLDRLPRKRARRF